MFKKILRFFGDNFIAGILVILPIAMTAFIVRFFIIKVNSIMLNPLLLKLGPYALQEEQRLLLARTTIFICVVFIIIFIGLMTRVIIIRRTFSSLEKLLYKLPMVNKIYGTTKEISQAFLGNKKSSFQHVVRIEYPRKGVYTLGFVTSKASERLTESTGGGEMLNIYVPTTPNPTSGLFVLVRKEDVVLLDITVEEALKVVISAGVISPSARGRVPRGQVSS